MKKNINPMIDFAFYHLLANPDYPTLTSHLFTSLLDPDISQVQLTNHRQLQQAFSDMCCTEYPSARFSAVNAIDLILSVNMSLAESAAIPELLLYGKKPHRRVQNPGSSIFFTTQLCSVQQTDKQNIHHQFKMIEAFHYQLLTDNAVIDVVDLTRWKQAIKGGRNKFSSLKDKWLCFLCEARCWERLPEELEQDDVFQQALCVLHELQEEHADNYEARYEQLMRAKCDAENIQGEALQRTIQQLEEEHERRLEVEQQNQKIYNQLKALIAKQDGTGISQK